MTFAPSSSSLTIGRALLKGSALLLVVVVSASAQAPHGGLTQNCAGCHNDKLKSGGLVLTSLDLDHPERSAKDWEKAILKIRSGMMPPAGVKRDPAAIAGLADFLEHSLDRAAVASPNPGRPALHRLNRAEYANSVHDLLGLDIDVPPAARRRHEPRLRQHGGGAHHLAHSDGRLYPRRGKDQPRWRLAIPAHQSAGRDLSSARHASRRRATWKARPSARAAASPCATTFRPMASTCFELTLYFTTNTASCSARSEKGEQIEIAVNGERVALLDINPRMKVR